MFLDLWVVSIFFIENLKMNFFLFTAKNIEKFNAEKISMDTRNVDAYQNILICIEIYWFLLRSKLYGYVFSSNYIEKKPTKCDFDMQIAIVKTF